MLDWLQKSGGYTANGLTIEERRELENLRKEIIKYREMAQHENKEEEDVHSDEDEDEDEEVVPDIDVKKIPAKAKRSAVSAEVYGLFNKKEDFKPKVIKKTPDQVNRIKSRIIQSFLFQGLEQCEVEIVINAMEERVFEAGDTVITQGEKGDCLYVVEKGDLDCYKKFVKN
jgi:cAMP-dependent protein kinase regulator